MNSGPRNHADEAFDVSYSVSEPQKGQRTTFNSFGLRGDGRVVLDDEFLTFVGETDRAGAASPRFRRDQVANVDYDPDTAGFVIRTSHNEDFVVLWAKSRAQAEALWARLPQQKSPEFLARREQIDRFEHGMAELGRRAWVTPALIALNVVMFGVMLALGGDLLRPPSELLIRLGSNLGPLTWGGEYWRLLTAAFLHGGIFHIVLNMYALYQGGGLVERLYGSGRFALIYLLSALAGSVASGWWEEMRNSVGASGAIFGVYGAMFAFFALRRADFPPQVWKSIGTSALLFCGYSLAIGAASPMIDNAAHVGGLLGGFVSGLLLVRPFNVESRTRPQPARLAVAALAVLLPLLWLAQPLTGGTRAARRAFTSQLQDFGQLEETFSRRYQELNDRNPQGATSGDYANEAREQIFDPWRHAAQALLRGETLANDGSREYRLQAAIREYIRAKERALVLTEQALQSGSSEDRSSANAAWDQVRTQAERLRAIRASGT